MTTLKEDAKDVSLSVAYDLMLVAFVVCWVIAVILAFLEISLWIVFGLFLLGCGIFFALIYLSRKSEEKEQEKQEEQLEEQKSFVEEMLES
jgi:membrane protein implicated in regulation of membrane protease activity